MLLKEKEGSVRGGQSGRDTGLYVRFYNMFETCFAAKLVILPNNQKIPEKNHRLKVCESPVHFALWPSVAPGRLENRPPPFFCSRNNIRRTQFEAVTYFLGLPRFTNLRIKNHIKIKLEDKIDFFYH